MADQVEDLRKHLRSLGFKPAGHGGRHERWELNSVPYYIPGKITGIRDLRNYKRQVSRIAKCAGNQSAQSRKKPPRSPKENPKKKQRRDGVELKRVIPATREEIEAWNARTERAWRLPSSRLEGEYMENSSARTIRPDDRIPFIDRALQEAGRSLNVKEMCRAIGWVGEAHEAAVRRLVTHSSHYRKVGTAERNRRFEIADRETVLLPSAEIQALKEELRVLREQHAVLLQEREMFFEEARNTNQVVASLRENESRYAQIMQNLQESGAAMQAHMNVIKACVDSMGEDADPSRALLILGKLSVLCERIPAAP